MRVLEGIADLKEQIKAWKNEGLSIAFVPTMGYLHEGHLSLIEACKEDKIVVSIFVNPLQFGPGEDLATYPRDLRRDARLCEENGVDLLFTPQVAEFYPSDFSSFVDMSGLSERLCGAKRAGHFRGVCTVLMKFFHLIQPDRAYFGQKDAQQCAVVARMVEDLNLPLELVVCPIVREEDGLAKSSRNVYLNAREREAALVLSRAIFLGERMVKEGERRAEVILEAMRGEIQKESLARVDYISLVDPHSLEDLERIEGGVLGAVAVYVGRTRLIDNFLLQGLK